MIEFNQKEKDFLNSLEEARIATSHDDIPQVKPASFVYQNNAILFASKLFLKVCCITFKEVFSPSKVKVHLISYKI